MSQLVITAVGPDRAGLVEHLAAYLHDAGANLADSRMVNLRGRFALLMLVECSEEQANTIRANIPTIGNDVGLTIQIVDGAGADEEATTKPGLPLRLKVFAMDQPGIVHRITQLAHRYNANIEELETELRAGSYSGVPLFALDLTMTVPPQTSIRNLRADLESLCDELNCDFELTRGDTAD